MPSHRILSYIVIGRMCRISVCNHQILGCLISNVIIEYYGMPNVALFDLFIFLFDLRHWYCIFLYLNSISSHCYCIFLYLISVSVNFYCIVFISILYSIICIQEMFVSIVYVSLYSLFDHLYLIINDLCALVFHYYSMTSIIFQIFHLYSIVLYLYCIIVIYIRYFHICI